jgi:hypothetical protein
MKRVVPVAVVAIAVALAAVLATATTQAKNPVITQELATWELDKLEVVSPGEVLDLEEGTFIRGYALQAKARAAGGNLVPEGTFSATMDVFSPSRDMPGQTAGMWYVQGHWTITRKDAPVESTKARHSPDVVKGDLRAELQFNPIDAQVNWTALAGLPMSPAAGRWGRGQGSIGFDVRGTGSLSLDVALWPAMPAQ